MKNWLIALQTPHNEIKFITNYDDNYAYLGYYDFFYKMNPIYIKDPEKFRKTLDEIGRVVVLNVDTGDWERQPIEVTTDHSVETLIKYNENKEEENMTKRDRYKNFIEKFTKRKHAINRD